MNQDEKMVLLIVQESLVEGDASPARQKDLAEMLNRVISGRLTQHALDAATVAPKCTTEKLCPVHNVWHAAPPRK